MLKILVSANYKYIPSLEDILETTAVTRLRNQLLEAEYYQLAVEVRRFTVGLITSGYMHVLFLTLSSSQVSTKSGLDPSGVWHAWGMALLKAGCMRAAREKFARCLKAPVDRNQLNQGTRLLQDIVQHLESSIRLTSSTVSSETARLGHPSPHTT